MSASARRTTCRSLSQRRAAASLTVRWRRTSAFSATSRASPRDPLSRARRRSAQLSTSRSASSAARLSAAPCSVSLSAAGSASQSSAPSACKASSDSVAVTWRLPAQRLQFGAELPVHIGGEARTRRIIAFGGAMERDRAHLRRILGNIGEPVAAREIADPRRRQRREPREAAIGECPGPRARRGIERGSRPDIIRNSHFERIAFCRHGPCPSFSQHGCRRGRNRGSWLAAGCPLPTHYYLPSPPRRRGPLEVSAFVAA